jgi:hypothetical protein
MTERVTTPDTASWFAISVDNGEDYAALKFKDRYSKAAMIELIRKHYWPPTPPPEKKRKTDAEEEEEEEEESDSVECEFDYFGPIDPTFVSFVRDFQDYDQSKHSNYFLFEAESIRK